MRLLSHFESIPLATKYLTMTPLPSSTMPNHFQKARKEPQLKSIEELMCQRPGQGAFLWREYSVCLLCIALFLVEKKKMFPLPQAK